MAYFYRFHLKFSPWPELLYHNQALLQKYMKQINQIIAEDLQHRVSKKKYHYYSLDKIQLICAQNNSNNNSAKQIYMNERKCVKSVI